MRRLAERPANLMFFMRLTRFQQLDTGNRWQRWQLEVFAKGTADVVGSHDSALAQLRQQPVRDEIACTRIGKVTERDDVEYAPRRIVPRSRPRAVPGCPPLPSGRCPWMR